MGKRLSKAVRGPGLQLPGPSFADLSLDEHRLETSDELEWEKIRWTLGERPNVEPNLGWPSMWKSWEVLEEIAEAHLVEVMG